MDRKFPLVFLLLLLVSFGWSSHICSDAMNKCFKQFKRDLIQHGKTKFADSEAKLDHICNQTNGIYQSYLDCGKAAQQLNCTSFVLADIIDLKLRIYRYRWKPHFFHQLCSDVQSPFTKSFVEHEECIGSVLNQRSWRCDTDYDKPRKKIEWRLNNVNKDKSCCLWKKFRNCIRSDVEAACGVPAAAFSDQLFHHYQSYFESYQACLEGGPTDGHPLCFEDGDHPKEMNETDTDTDAMAQETTIHMAVDRVDNARGVDDNNDNATQSVLIVPVFVVESVTEPNHNMTQPEHKRVVLLPVAEDRRFLSEVNHQNSSHFEFQFTRSSSFGITSHLVVVLSSVFVSRL